MKQFIPLSLLILAQVLSPSAATCGCECNDNLVAIPYIAELGKECAQPAHRQGPACKNFVCAKCGKILECYVDTGDANLDNEICAFVNTPEFCPDITEQKTFTTCHQQCDGAQGVKCYTKASGNIWSACPAKIGISSCLAGAGNLRTSQAAALSNFAGYKYCPAGVPTCEATGVCAGGVNALPLTEQTYKCTSTECVSHEEATITCEVEKCDSAGICQCPA